MNLFRRIYVLIIFNFRTFSDSLVQKMPIKGLKNTGKLDFRQEIISKKRTRVDLHTTVQHGLQTTESLKILGLSQYG